MQLKIKRSQREGGLISRTAIFCLDARVQFTEEEQRHITRYKLQKEPIYSSEAAQRAFERSDSYKDGSVMGGFKALAFAAVGALKLNISIGSLQQGQHVECKSLEELLGAEDAIMAACRNLKTYLDTASTFDGREVLFDFETGQPEVVAHAVSPTPALIAPPNDASVAHVESPAPIPPEIVEDAQYEDIPDAPAPETVYSEEGVDQPSADISQYITQKNVLIGIFGAMLIALMIQYYPSRADTATPSESTQADNGAPTTANTAFDLSAVSPGPQVAPPEPSSNDFGGQPAPDDNGAHWFKDDRMIPPKYVTDSSGIRRSIPPCSSYELVTNLLPDKVFSCTN